MYTGNRGLQPNLYGQITGKQDSNAHGEDIPLKGYEYKEDTLYLLFLIFQQF